MAKTLEHYPFLKRIIESWPSRFKKARIRQKEMAFLANISESHISQIINLKIPNPRMKTIDAVEKVLHERGV